MIGKFVSKCCDDNCVPFENPIPKHTRLYELVTTDA